ncbi:MAG: GHKL domain-containing protein [Ferruginibacter sp.]|nr:GHKL domain-containing protein [Ferruginibacter sp.]
MIPHTPVNGLYFVCGHQGDILRVLRDDINILPSLGKPVTFFELFDLHSRQKAQQFWDGLHQESAIFDWELNVGIKPLPQVYKFSGFITGGEILITASKQDEVLANMFDELMGMNNEQQNLLRHSEKTLSTLKKVRENKAVDILNEMTQLNNELVNTQRKLMKQNAEINRLNKQLQYINADLEQFTYVASHDLKEPLRMVTGFMELLKTKYGEQLDKKAHSYIDLALDGGNRMQKMIIDLLELSRTGRKNAVKELASLDEILNEVKENIFILIEETRAEIIVKTALPVVAVYRADFTRLLQNLLSNAIKFRKKDIQPVVLVDVKEKEDEWLFSVEDNGIGIGQDKFEKIFEIFARLHSKETYEGTGIGLAVCKKVVEHHGGKIWIESEEGKGSTFYFTIKK